MFPGAWNDLWRLSPWTRISDIGWNKKPRQILVTAALADDLSLLWCFWNMFSIVSVITRVAIHLHSQMPIYLHKYQSTCLSIYLNSTWSTYQFSIYLSPNVPAILLSSGTSTRSSATAGKVTGCPSSKWARRPRIAWSVMPWSRPWLTMRPQPEAGTTRCLLGSPDSNGTLCNMKTYTVFWRYHP